MTIDDHMMVAAIAAWFRAMKTDIWYDWDRWTWWDIGTWFVDRWVTAGIMRRFRRYWTHSTNYNLVSFGSRPHTVADYFFSSPEWEKTDENIIRENHWKVLRRQQGGPRTIGRAKRTTGRNANQCPWENRRRGLGHVHADLSIVMWRLWTVRPVRALCPEGLLVSVIDEKVLEVLISSRETLASLLRSLFMSPQASQVSPGKDDTWGIQW